MFYILDNKTPVKFDTDTVADMVKRACSWEEAETVHKEVLARVTTHSVSG